MGSLHSMVVFQLKGSALLWWKTLLPQLNMAIEDMSWELFKEWFQERYILEELIELQLNEFNVGTGADPGFNAQECTNKTLTTDPFDNTWEADEVSPEVEVGVVAGLQCLQP
jgi:hypothetical protein